jgi:hypothetical protein
MFLTKNNNKIKAAEINGVLGWCNNEFGFRRWISFCAEMTHLRIIMNLD